MPIKLHSTTSPGFFGVANVQFFSASTFYEAVVQLIMQALVVIVQPGKFCFFVGALWQLWQQMCWLVSGAANEHCTKQMSRPPALSPASLVICSQVPGARQGDELAVKQRASALAAATGLGCEDESATVERQCSNKCALRASNVGLCEQC